MEQSLFFKWLANRFSATITRFSETINGIKGDAPKYLFMQYLQKNFSVDMKWASLNGNGASVAADVVALDASVPLKKRDSLVVVEGDVPKLGMKKRKSEREMQELQILEATNKGGNRTSQILAKLFNDPLAVTRGVYERLEYMFLEGLSTGYATVTEAVNEGTAVRINYGYNPANIYPALIRWSNPNATPITDLNAIIDDRSAKGRASTYMFMDRTAFNNFRNKADVRGLYAASIGFNGQGGAPIPNIEQINDALNANGMPTIIIVDRTVNVEKNGITTPVKPWAAGAVVIVESLDLGDITWSTLVEANNPKKDVLYAVTDDYILVSTFHSNDPFSETTSSQALALPVINNVEGISLIDSENTEGPEVSATDKTVSTTSTTVAGTATAKPGRSISARKWTIISNPVGSVPTLASDTTATVTLGAMSVDGEYVLQFEATDSDGNKAATQVTITKEA